MAMILFVGLSSFIAIKFNNILKFKKTFYITLFIYFIVLNNIYMFLLSIFLFFGIMILNHKNKFICYVFSGISLLACVFLPITIMLILTKINSLGVNGASIRKEIYKQEYYECGKYEIFYYSGGATDRFHYAVMEKHKYIEIKNLLEIGYDKQVGDTLEEYNAMKESGKCNKVIKWK